MELLGKTNIDFIGMRKITFVISIIITVIGILGVVSMIRGTANMGIDFTGGTSLQLRFDKPVEMAAVRKALHSAGIEAELQEVKEGNKLLVKLARKSQVTVGKAAETVPAALQKGLPGTSVTVESTTEIGPAVGDKLRKDTLIAVAISMLGIIVYIAWRFDFNFGVGAVVATLHDIMAMFAVFYLFDKEINLLFVTAVLTIAGYSLTDTVVIFDRIRENLHKDLKGALHTIINRSVNEVLSRSIVTSITTFLSASALLFFGGEMIHDFALALVVGVVVGAYSSVFVASPVIMLLAERTANKAGSAGAGPAPAKA
ncbi:protein translocase subunit SecF [Trichlorobacter ammonificans]|uniref:protein translocase subunit SecF n=1 Tax=Trichlorobacter ammonificans TaxID=2916410 RepID=UPI002737C04E|nr:protein translocase subunit SecF [Trichlorobacter ammonificans]